MKRKLLIGALVGLFIAVSLLVVAIVMFPGGFPISHIEALKQPVKVQSWGPDGLHLAGGRVVLPQGFTELPIRSKALAAGTGHGVEIGPDGRIYGLVKIWHWCGNDRVKYDLTRIDLGLLLGYLGEGKSKIAADPMYEPEERGGNFTDHGWNISDLYSFRHFVKDKYPREAAAMRL